MAVIRPMEIEDVDAVRRVEAAAFGARMRHAPGGGDELSWRTRANVLACWERDPEGCYVAEQDGSVVGLIFSRTWGTVGWFGTFAVLPRCQGQGIGKSLVAASLAYLRQDPRRVIGLETVADSASNLGLYLKRGFQARSLTLELSKSLTHSETQASTLLRWSEAGEELRFRCLAELREITSAIHRGLDYSKEITSIAAFGFGDTLFLREGERVVGASTVRLVGVREDEGQDRAVISPLVLHPAHTDAANLGALVKGSEALASSHGARELLVHANTRYDWAVRQLLEAGYRVNRGLVRMILRGTDAGPAIDEFVNLARWAG